MKKKNIWWRVFCWFLVACVILAISLGSIYYEQHGMYRAMKEGVEHCEGNNQVYRIYVNDGTVYAECWGKLCENPEGVCIDAHLRIGE